jgi:hypothetical protein
MKLEEILAKLKELLGEGADTGSLSTMLESYAEDHAQGIKANRDKALAQLQKLKGLVGDRDDETLRQLLDVDLEEFQRLQKASEEQDRKKAEDKGEYDKLLEADRTKHRDAISRLTKERDALMNEIKGLTKTTALDEAMAKAGVVDELRAACKAMFGEMSTVVGEGADRKAVIEVDGNSVDLVDHVVSWAKSDAGKAFRAAPVNSGAHDGSSNQSGDSEGGDDDELGPFRRDNLTEQGQLKKVDPEKYAKLHRQWEAVQEREARKAS